FVTEGRPQKDVDKLTTYMVIATIVGARLGHCLFYNPSYYLSNPIEILKIWEGGLASHGATIGILIAIWLFVRNTEGYTWLWVLDRLVIVVALTGAMIRTGNLMNSEMEGTETKANYGIVYARGTKEALNFSEEIESIKFRKGGEMQSDEAGRHPVTAIITFNRRSDFGQSDADKHTVESSLRNRLLTNREVVEHIDFGSGPLQYKFDQKNGRQVLEIYGVGISRHAAQLYEATYCLLIMILLYWLWSTRRDQLPSGFLFALFNILLWSLRFVDEFFKMDQEDFEADLPLNMGQWLSIPMFLMGVGVMIYIYQKRGIQKA
ncbi:MAG: prolipoprotein diacylglyceryl transferase, partial [Bacteroidota bacterium]